MTLKKPDLYQHKDLQVELVLSVKKESIIGYEHF